MNNITKRAFFLIMVIISMFCFMIISFFKLQIIEGDFWRNKAKKQHSIILKEPAARGGFFDRNGVPFISDISKVHLNIDCKKIKNIDSLSDNIALILNNENLKEEIINKINKGGRSREVLSWLDIDEKEKILKWWRSFYRKEKIERNAIFFVNDYKRYYFYDYMLGQILNSIRYKKNEDSGEGIPIGGLELYYNDILKGKMGERIVYRSTNRILESNEYINKPVNGSDIYLTIDTNIQLIMESSLEYGVKTAKAKSGWAIAVDVNNGEILGIAQYPFFSPSSYNKYYNSSDLLEHTKAKPLMEVFEPGSTIKPLALALFLDANNEKEFTFDIDEMIDVSNGKFKGRSTPIVDTRRHHYLNGYLAIQKSSNVYMAKIIERIVNEKGHKWFRRKFLNMFEFDKNSVVDFKIEELSHFPEVGKVLSNGALEWSRTTPHVLSFGYNMLLNSMQVLKAYLPIANDGYLMDLSIVKEIINNETGEVIKYNKEKRRVFDEDVAIKVRKAMSLVNSKGGSSIGNVLPGYSSVCKTGTTRKNINGKYSKNSYISSFIGMFPTNKPKILLFIVLDEPSTEYIPGLGNMYYGFASSGPIFKDIGEKIAKYLLLKKDRPLYNYNDVRYNITDEFDYKFKLEQNKIYEKYNA